MSTYCIAAFLILFGVNELIATNLPHWFLGVVALASALAILVEGKWKKTP